MDLLYVYVGVISVVGLLSGLFIGLFAYFRRRNKQFQGPDAETQKISSGRENLKTLPKPIEQPSHLVASSLEVQAEKKSRVDSVLYQGLEKNRQGWVQRLADLIRGKRLDASLIESMEEVLIGADIGVKTSSYLLEQVKNQLDAQALKDQAIVWRTLIEETKKILSVKSDELAQKIETPKIFLIVGVNGVGKTTSIGKLAKRFTQSGQKVILAAGDTFRAAAAEQLEIWGQRSDAKVIRGKQGVDPSSVIYEAVRAGIQQGVDIVLLDTAGRLHVKAQLMDELQKIRRVIQKAMPSAPHETWLVLDATSGQNAMMQAKTFKEMVDVTGVVLTKLDGTAKGGIVLGICHELGIPIRYIGVGEKAEDLRPFVVDDFVEALYADRHEAGKGT